MITSWSNRCPWLHQNDPQAMAVRETAGTVCSDEELAGNGRFA